jgi:uroporphyrinogen III methyltransferase/synthase
VADLLLRARPGNVLLLRQEGLPDELPLRLQAAGATVDDIAAYRVVPAGPAPDLDDLDLIVFASSGSVRTLDRLIDEGKPRMRGIPAVCMGPKTAQAAREYGFKIEAVAATASFDGLVDVALQVLRERADGPAGPVSLRSPSEL